MVFRVRSIFAALGFLLGAFLGVNTGIVMGGGATSGWWFFAVLFALIGWVASAPVMDLVARFWARKGEKE